MQSPLRLFKLMQCLAFALALQSWGQEKPGETQGEGSQTSPVQASEGEPNRETADVNRDGQVLSPKDVIVEDALPTTNAGLRPERVERPELPASVAAQLERFRDYSQVYLLRQQNLKKRMVGANDRERAILREQLADLRSEFNDALRQRREELRDRAASLREKLPSHKEVIDSIREQARDNVRSTLEESRTRRGTD